MTYQPLKRDADKNLIKSGDGVCEKDSSYSFSSSEILSIAKSNDPELQKAGAKFCHTTAQHSTFARLQEGAWLSLREGDRWTSMAVESIESKWTESERTVEEAERQHRNKLDVERASLQSMVRINENAMQELEKKEKELKRLQARVAEMGKKYKVRAAEIQMKRKVITELEEECDGEWRTEWFYDKAELSYKLVREGEPTTVTFQEVESKVKAGQIKPLVSSGESGPPIWYDDRWEMTSKPKTLSDQCNKVLSSFIKDFKESSAFVTVWSICFFGGALIRGRKEG